MPTARSIFKNRVYSDMDDAFVAGNFARAVARHQNALKRYAEDHFIRAARRNDLKAVKMFLRGRDGVPAVSPLVTDRDTLQAIHYAAKFGSLSMVRYLLDLDASPNASSDVGETPLHMAASSIEMQPSRPSVVRLLIQRGARVDAKTKYGETPLHYAAYTGALGVARVLVQSGASVNSRSTEGKYPLHYAASRGNITVARYLLANGARVNAINVEKGWTPLQFASRGTRPYPKMVALLLKHGADPNTTDKEGRTPLFTTHPEIEKMLLLHGARIVRNRNGRLPEGNSVVNATRIATRAELAKRLPPNLVQAVLHRANLSKFSERDPAGSREAQANGRSRKRYRTEGTRRSSRIRRQRAN